MVYTIGYAGIEIDMFLKLLQELNISLLIDVRSLPKSKYFYKFNDNNLKKELARINVGYENWKDEFGARQENSEFYTNGIMDYEKFAESNQFKNGLFKITKYQESNENVCLMCSEIDPINCHRAILCGRKIAENGFKVKHIIARRNGTILLEDHNDFEKRLMETTKVNNLSEAYRKQNKKIGYKLT